MVKELVELFGQPVPRSVRMESFSIYLGTTNTFCPVCGDRTHRCDPSSYKSYWACGTCAWVGREQDCNTEPRPQR